MSGDALRVSIIGPAHPYKGGAVHHTTALAHHAAAAGHCVAVESWRAQYPKLLYPGQLTVAEPEVELFEPTWRRLSWRRPDGWIREGRRIARQSDVVVMQYHNPLQAVCYVGMLRGMRGIGARTVVIMNNVQSHEARRFDRALVSAMVNRVDLVVVHDEESATRARELGAARVRIARLPPHLPVARQPVAPADSRSTGVRDCLLFFGLVRPYKGLDVLLRAMAKADISARLVVAGEFWSGVDETRQLATALGLADRVTLREGYVPAGEIAQLFDACDALVLPYRTATGSQNVLMAFAHDRPVIVTKTGSLADPVADGVDGIVCRPDDVEDLARALERFYSPGTPERLRANVKRPDDSTAWPPYLDALLAAPDGR